MIPRPFRLWADKRFVRAHKVQSYRDADITPIVVRFNQAITEWSSGDRHSWDEAKFRRFNTRSPSRLLGQFCRAGHPPVSLQDFNRQGASQWRLPASSMPGSEDFADIWQVKLLLGDEDLQGGLGKPKILRGPSGSSTPM
eukprot:s5201_g1.t2